MSKKSIDIVNIGEVAEIYDGPHATPKKISCGPIFLGISSLNKGRLELDKSAHLSDEDFIKWTRRITPKEGDVVFSYETRIGEVAIIPKNIKCCLGRRMGLVRTDKKKLNPKYFLYQYLSPDFQKFLKSRIIPGSTVERILLTEFPKFPICLPPLKEQIAISELLGFLDEKIDLNFKINHKLEVIVDAVFKSWFVDFDPVNAKVDRRKPYGMGDEIAALFPSHFIESEIGLIPSGWEISKIGDIVNLIPGRSYASKDLQASAVALVTLKSFERGGGYKQNGLKPYIGKYNEEQIVEPGELIVAKTDVTQSADVIGRVALVRGNKKYEKLVASLDVMIVRPNISEISIPYLYCLMRTYDYVSHILGHTNGTTVLHLSKEGLPSYRFVKPPKILLNKFTEYSEPIFKKIEDNEEQNRTLAEIRDLLLPKLLSGEIQIKQAEKLIGEVA